MAWWVSLLLFASVIACDRTPGKAEPGHSSTTSAGAVATAPGERAAAGFGERSARLAIVPAGHELGEAKFSADGRHVAFVATKDGRAFVFLDAKKYGPYEDARGLLFPEGRSGLAYVARQGGKEFVVANGEEGARFSGVGRVLFVSDGRISYSAQQDGGWRVVVGTRETNVPGASDPWPYASGDGKRVVYTEQHAGKGKSNLRACSLELTDCVAGGEYDGIASHRTDQSGAQLAFIASKNGKEAVAMVKLDKPGLTERTAGWYDAVSLFAASDGGGHLAFLAHRGDLQLLVRDGEELPFPEMASPLEMTVSRNGRVLTTAILGSKVVAFVDGKRAGREYEAIYFPVFSPDGSRHAFATGDVSNNALVVNGEQGPLFDKVVAPRFTPDGARVVYRARKNGERFAVVADARAKTIREHPHYEAVFDVVFSPDGKSVGYGVRTGQELWWKIEKL